MESVSSNSRYFWKTIGRIGVGNERKRCAPNSVRLEDGIVTNKEQEVLDKWTRDYESLLNHNKNNNSFDESFLANAKNHLEEYYKSGDKPTKEHTNNESFNTDITLEEVTASIK